jgi:hypothetical protein
MPDNLLDQARVDRRALAVTSFTEAERADRAYWHLQTPDERLEALEPCRQIACGYASARHIPALRDSRRHSTAVTAFWRNPPSSSEQEIGGGHQTAATPVETLDADDGAFLPVSGLR